MSSVALDDIHAFDSSTEALLWAGWVNRARKERTIDRERYTVSDRPYHCDDVFICLNRALMEGKIEQAHVKVARYFMHVGYPPGSDDRDHVHKLWEEVIAAVEPYLKQKRIVY